MRDTALRSRRCGGGRRSSTGALATTACLVGVALATQAAGCGQTPTEFSPLARAVGEVRGVIFSFQRLTTLGPEDGIYEAWALVEAGRAISLGRFNIDENGQPVDEEGNRLERFSTTAENLSGSVGALVTVEPPGDADDRPSGFQILQGPFIDGVAHLTVPGPTGLPAATGSYRVFTPTDGPGTNEASGLWATNEAGGASLSLPEITRGFTYEHFVIIGGIPVIMGRFERPDGPDSVNRHSGPQPAPQVPGEDLLRDPPPGLTFPADLSGARLIVTLEPRASDVLAPSQLVILEAILPSGLVGGETIPLVNRAANFPTATAVLF